MSLRGGHRAERMLSERSETKQKSKRAGKEDMRIKKFKIKGDTHLLLKEINSKFPLNHVYESDQVFLLAYEEYTFRTNSDLMSLLIFEKIKPDEYIVEIISGGGGQSLSAIDWGASKNRIEKIFKTIDSLCQKYNLTISDLSEENRARD